MVGIRFCREYDDGDDGDEDDDQAKSTSHQSRNDIDHVDDDNDDDDVGDDDGDVDDDEDDGQATSNCHQARDDDDNAVGDDDDEESLPKMFTASRPQPKSPPQCLPPAHFHQTINNVIASIIGNASGGREIGLIRSEKNQEKIDETPS